MNDVLQIPLPTEMAPYKADLEYFFQTMVRKLHVNRHKGTSKELSVSTLMVGIQRELRELEQAIDKEGQFDAPLEAADIANFSFLIASTIWHMTREDFEKTRKDMLNRKIDNPKEPWKDVTIPIVTHHVHCTRCDRPYINGSCGCSTRAPRGES